jgi:hypothetical protein
MENDAVGTILSEIADLLQTGGEAWAAVMVRHALSGSEPASSAFWCRTNCGPVPVLSQINASPAIALGEGLLKND